MVLPGAVSIAVSVGLRDTLPHFPTAILTSTYPKEAYTAWLVVGVAVLVLYLGSVMLLYQRYSEMYDGAEDTTPKMVRRRWAAFWSRRELSEPRGCYPLPLPSCPGPHTHPLLCPDSSLLAPPPHTHTDPFGWPRICCLVRRRFCGDSCQG